MSIIGGAYLTADGKLHIVDYRTMSAVPPHPHVGIVFEENGALTVKMLNYQITPTTPSAVALVQSPAAQEHTPALPTSAKRAREEEPSVRKQRNYPCTMPLEQVLEFLRANVAKEDSEDFYEMLRRLSKVDPGTMSRFRRVALVENRFYSSFVLKYTTRLAAKYHHIESPEKRPCDNPGAIVSYSMKALRVWKYLLYYRAEIMDFFRGEWALSAEQPVVNPVVEPVAPPEPEPPMPSEVPPTSEITPSSEEVIIEEPVAVSPVRGADDTISSDLRSKLCAAFRGVSKLTITRFLNILSQFDTPSAMTQICVLNDFSIPYGSDVMREQAKQTIFKLADANRRNRRAWGACPLLLEVRSDLRGGFSLSFDADLFRHQNKIRGFLEREWKDIVKNRCRVTVTPPPDDAIANSETH